MLAGPPIKNIMTIMNRLISACAPILETMYAHEGSGVIFSIRIQPWERSRASRMLKVVKLRR